MAKNKKNELFFSTPCGGEIKFSFAQNGVYCDTFKDLPRMSWAQAEELAIRIITSAHKLRQEAPNND